MPAFIAANYVMTYYCKHNICPMETDIPEATDTVQVSRNLHFEQISDLCGISLDQIKSLNPQFKKSIIPVAVLPLLLRAVERVLETATTLRFLNSSLLRWA